MSSQPQVLLYPFLIPIIFVPLTTLEYSRRVATISNKHKDIRYILIKIVFSFLVSCSSKSYGQLILANIVCFKSLIIILKLVL